MREWRGSIGGGLASKERRGKEKEWGRLGEGGEFSHWNM